jgi:glutamate/tyrosine decarboxylase-like PLP-dependent enzyme
VSSLFLGPKGENAASLERHVVALLRDYVHWRKNYFPDDPLLWSTYDTLLASKQHSALDTAVSELAAGMRRNFPFYSPRYLGHQLSDVLMASILGQFVGSLYNPNNVTPEAAPVTADMEIDVAGDLMRLVGFNAPPEPELALSAQKYQYALKNQFGWAHLTSGGTVANIEALWAARSAAYFPIWVRKVAVDNDLDIRVKLPIDHHAADPAAVHDVSITDVDDYQLSRLRVNESVYLLPKLVEAFECALDITTQEASARTDTALTQAKAELPYAKLAAEYPPVILCACTVHYSINKAADLLGIGAQNIVRVPVDSAFRMDMGELRVALEAVIEARKVPVAVIGILGTTEEGAIDPLHELVDLRLDFERSLNTSFWLHCDGAWGGYLRTLVTLTPKERFELVCRRVGRLLGIPYEGSLEDWVESFASRVRVGLDRRLGLGASETPPAHVQNALRGLSEPADDYGARLRCLRSLAAFEREKDTGARGPNVGKRSDGLGGSEWPFALSKTEMSATLSEWHDYLVELLKDTYKPYFEQNRRAVTNELIPDTSHLVRSLLAVSRFDSVTVDPHKMGYINYPCGSIAYRNDRIRHLFTQDAPYITIAGDDRRVVYYPQRMGEVAPDGELKVTTMASAPWTLEGSRPGSATAALWLSHRVLAPDVSGYGHIVAQSLKSARYFYELLGNFNKFSRGQNLGFEFIRLSQARPDTNIVIFALKPSAGRSLWRMNALTRLVYGDFSISSELGEREYSYSQRFFLSRTTMESRAYPYSGLQSVLSDAGIHNPRVQYGKHGLLALRATVMTPYLMVMANNMDKDLLREFMHDLAKSAQKGIVELSRLSPSSEQSGEASLF